MIKKVGLLATLALAVSLGSGCAYIGGGTNLAQVARNSGLENVTTGDGNYPNYVATGHHTGVEIGIAVGIPFIIKLFEIYPAATNEDLLTDVAKAAKADGASSMINVAPNKDLYIGFPFGIVGLYVDSASGTGIRPR